MPDEFRETGRMASVYGTRITFGVDEGDVFIGFSGTNVLLGHDAREEFSRLYFEAIREAEAAMPP